MGHAAKVGWTMPEEYLAPGDVVAPPLTLSEQLATSLSIGLVTLAESSGWPWTAWSVRSEWSKLWLAVARFGWRVCPKWARGFRPWLFRHLLGWRFWATVEDGDYCQAVAVVVALPVLAEEVQQQLIGGLVRRPWLAEVVVQLTTDATDTTRTPCVSAHAIKVERQVDGCLRLCLGHERLSLADQARMKAAFKQGWALAVSAVTLRFGWEQFGPVWARSIPVVGATADYF